MPMKRLHLISPWNSFRILVSILGVCLTLSLFPGNASAIDPASSLFDNHQANSSDKDKPSQPLALPEETPNPSPSVFSILARIFLSLVFIGGLIFLTVWGVKWVWERQGWNNPAEQGKPIKVLSSTFLAPRKSIHLVEIGKRMLVVGVGTDELNCLDVITEPDEIEDLRRITQDGFPRLFARAINRNESIQNKAETKKIIEESNQVVGGYLDKLKKISKKKAAERSVGGKNES